jgi:hypothetical protein
MVPSTKEDTQPLRNLQFLIYFTDPDHNLVHSTVSQAVPESWLGLWDTYEWVEDLVAEALRLSVEVIGQEYVVARMGWASKATMGDEPADKTEDATPATATDTEES